MPANGLFGRITARAAREFGDTAAFVAAGGWEFDYASLDRCATEAAGGLRLQGLGEGDVVALVMPSTPDYIVAYLATAACAAITAGVNPRLTPPERGRLVEVADPKLVITTDDLRDGLPDGPQQVVIEPAAGPSDLLASVRSAEGEPELPELEPDPERPIAIVFTSGTTGEPRGAVFCERQLEAIIERDIGGRWGGGGAMLASTQFAHVGFMTKLPWYLMSGGTTHLLDHWRAADALRLVAQNGMTSVGGVAPQMALMLKVPDFDHYDLSAVKTIIMGGGASPPALVEEARRRFDAGYSIRYSSTESGGVGTATAFDADDEEALLTVGRPRPGVELEIRNESNARSDDGEVGEIVLRSPTMMSGYWRDKEATDQTLRNGWLHTGDLGFIDDRGLLRLAGRSKEMYIRGGYNVYPMEVEAVLASHPAVADVAVVPRPDDVMGEVGVAVVVLRPGTEPPDADSMRAFAADRLAPYKLPEDVRVIDELPLTPMQKVDRRALAAHEADPR